MILLIQWENLVNNLKIHFMNRPELYNKTVDILFQAYFNDALEHGTCRACAVGNIVAWNWNEKFSTRIEYMEWREVFSTYRGQQRVTACQYKGDAKKQDEQAEFLAKLIYLVQTNATAFDIAQGVINYGAVNGLFSKVKFGREALMSEQKIYNEPALTTDTDRKES